MLWKQLISGFMSILHILIFNFAQGEIMDVISKGLRGYFSFVASFKLSFKAQFSHRQNLI